MKWGAGKHFQFITIIIIVAFLTIAAFAHSASHPPAAAPRIAPNVASPQQITSTVIFTATGPERTPEFAFSLQAPGSSAWVKMQDFSGMRSWSWDTTGLRPGTYGIAVDSRNPGSTMATRAVMTFTLSPLPAPSGVSINTAAAAGPAPASDFSFIAAASGGTGKYEYAFYLQQAGSSDWNMKQAYGESASWSPPADLKPGTYCVCVYARTKGTAPKKGFDAYTRIGFSVAGDHRITGVTRQQTSGMPAEAPIGGQEYALLQRY